MAFSPFKFLQEVRSETAKVTWPTRRETTITTIMVFDGRARLGVLLRRGSGDPHPRHLRSRHPLEKRTDTTHEHALVHRPRLFEF